MLDVLAHLARAVPGVAAELIDADVASLLRARLVAAPLAKLPVASCAAYVCTSLSS